MPSPIGKAIRTINKTPVPLTPTRKLGGGPLRQMFGREKTTQMEAFARVSTLFSIVDRIANATSQVDWHLYRTAQDRRRSTATGDEPKRTEITQHAALSLVTRPNEFMTGQFLREAVQQHYELTGEGWMVIAHQFGMPMELWPVRPDRMEPVPHETKFIAGYIYTSADGEQVPLERGQVIYMRRPNPLDPYRGMGPVQAAMVDLESAEAAAEWNRNFFRNSAEPGGIIEVDKRLEDDEFDEMVTRWREQHQGVNNAHRVALLEQGKWVERKYSMKDMEFAKLRGVSREIIREAFGVHPHMLGITEDVNKANAQEGERSFARWLTTPRVKRWRDAFNTELLPQFDPADGVAFDHERVVPEDREADDRERTSKAQAAQLLTGVGYDPAGVLDAFGLPAIDYVGPPKKAESLTEDQNRIAEALHWLGHGDPSKYWPRKQIEQGGNEGVPGGK